MKPMRSFVAAIAFASVAACVSQSEAAPGPAPSAAELPPAISITLPSNMDERLEKWRERPLTAGKWTYTGDARTTLATFRKDSGEGHFSLSCDLASKRVTLRRIGVTSGDPMKIRTETIERDLPTATPNRRVLETFAYLDGDDRLLDALVRSQDRFAVQISFIQIILPASPGLARVVEDCR